MRTQSITVSFRLSSAAGERLEQEARAHSISRHERAKRLVIEALTDARHQDLLAEAGLLKEQVSRLRSDLATTLEVVLLNVAKLDEAAVRRFVSERMRK